MRRSDLVQTETKGPRRSRRNAIVFGERQHCARAGFAGGTTTVPQSAPEPGAPRDRGNLIHEDQRTKPHQFVGGEKGRPGLENADSERR